MRSRKGFFPSNRPSAPASRSPRKFPVRNKFDTFGAINISGTVIHGDHLGRKLGFPTANIDRREYVRRGLRIKFGVWAGKVTIENLKLKIKNYPAGIVIGPLDKRGLPKLEAHLIGFKGPLYGKKITLQLYTYVRPYKKFSNLEAVKKQITRDIEKIKRMNI